MPLNLVGWQALHRAGEVELWPMEFQQQLHLPDQRAPRQLPLQLT